MVIVSEKCNVLPLEVDFVSILNIKRLYNEIEPDIQKQEYRVFTFCEWLPYNPA